QKGVQGHRDQVDANLVHERVARGEHSREERQPERAAVRLPGPMAGRRPRVARADPEHDQTDPGQTLPRRALAEKDDREGHDEKRRGAARDRVDQRQIAGPDHASEPGSPLAETDLRVRALESLLVEKGLDDPAALDVLIDTYETKVGPRNGARVVARAWVDPAYKTPLLADARSAVAVLGYQGRGG